MSLRTGAEGLEVMSTRRDASIYLMHNNFLFAVLTKKHMEDELEARDRDSGMRDTQKIYCLILVQPELGCLSSTVLASV